MNTLIDMPSPGLAHDELLELMADAWEDDVRHDARLQEEAEREEAERDWQRNNCHIHAHDADRWTYHRATCTCDLGADGMYA